MKYNLTPMKKTLLFISAVCMMFGMTACSGGSATSSDLTDREVLNLLFEKLNGSKWTKGTEGWGTERPLAEWEGVTAETGADGVERVLKLTINADSVSGDIPAEIGCLTELQELSIRVRNGQNSIANTVPAELFKLEKMEKLMLYINGKEHYTLPEDMNMPAIKILVISGPEGSFEGLCKLTSLETLNVSNFKGQIPESVGNLTNVHEMFWETSEEPQGRVPAAIGKMPNLKNLKIDYSAFIGGPGVANAPFPVELWDNTNLEYIFMRNVANQPSTIPGDKVAAMTNLKKIVLCRCGIEGTIPVEFFKSGKLTGFEIYDNNLTGEIPAEIANCVDLTGINLNRNNLTGSIPANLGNCTKLTTVWIQDNPELSGSIPASLSNCDRLIIMGFKGTKVSQDVPAALKAHKNFSKWHLFN